MLAVGKDEVVNTHLVSKEGRLAAGLHHGPPNGMELSVIFFEEHVVPVVEVLPLVLKRVQLLQHLCRQGQKDTRIAWDETPGSQETPPGGPAKPWEGSESLPDG